MRTPVLIAVVIFAIVAVLHLLRLVNGWDFIVGTYAVPTWMSVGGVIFPGGLAFWLWRDST